MGKAKAKKANSEPVEPDHDPDWERVDCLNLSHLRLCR